MNAPANIRVQQETRQAVAGLLLPPAVVDLIADRVIEKLEPRLAELAPQPQPRRWMTSRQAAEYVAVPWETFRLDPARWGGVKDGRAYVYDREELDRLRIEHRQHSRNEGNPTP